MVPQIGPAIKPNFYTYSAMVEASLGVRIGYEYAPQPLHGGQRGDASKCL